MSARTAAPEEVIERILETRMIAILRGFMSEEAVRAGRAFADGGVRVLEAWAHEGRYELFERAAADFLRSLGDAKGAR